MRGKSPDARRIGRRGAANNRRRSVPEERAMADPVGNRLDAMLQFNANALRLRSERQALLASNIANADTPNYKAVDFDFTKALGDANAASTNGTSAAKPATLYRQPAQAA